MVQLKPGKETICWAEGEGSRASQLTDKSPLSVLSDCCCKTIKHLLTYILLIALSTGKHGRGTAHA